MTCGLRILVFRTGHLGDSVCAIPAFRLVKANFPDSEIALLCDRPRNSQVPAKEVIDSLGIFERVMTYQTGLGPLTVWQLWRAVQAVKPELVVLLPQVRESEKCTRRKAQFFRRCGVPDVRTAHIPALSSSWNSNEPTRLVQVLNKVGIIGEKPACDLPVNPIARSAVEQVLVTLDVTPDKPYLVFCGGGKALTQRWPLERYADVLNNISAELGWPVVALGSPEEVEHYRENLLPTVDGFRLLPRRLVWSEVFELCRLATAYFGNDTGPMHVAAAVDCPVAVVMSSRNAPGIWDPDVEPCLVIRHRTECEDCFLRECLNEQHRCMTAITANEVSNRTISFLRSLAQNSPQ